MGSLQPGLPNPSLIPQHWTITIIDLKDCFFTIPLQDKDKVLFVFTIPEYNYGKPTQRYQWKVLPQGILNSPTLCQEFVDRALQPVRTQYPSMLTYHYTDDILLGTETQLELNNSFGTLLQSLKAYGLQLAPEKVQILSPFQYLGYTSSETTVRPQKIAICTDKLKTLNDFQKLLEDIN